MRFALPMMLCVAVDKAPAKNAHGSALAASEAMLLPSSGVFDRVATTTLNIMPAPTIKSGMSSAQAKPMTACVYRIVTSRSTNCITKSRAPHTSAMILANDGSRRTNATGGFLSSTGEVTAMLRGHLLWYEWFPRGVCSFPVSTPPGWGRVSDQSGHGYKSRLHRKLHRRCRRNLTLRAASGSVLPLDPATITPVHHRPPPRLVVEIPVHRARQSRAQRLLRLKPKTTRD